MAAGLFSMTTSRQHELDLHNPALCEELRIRDILDNVAVMTSGAFVAAYELSGVHSHYHTEEMRNRAKESFEAVLRSMPERSMRLHLRFEVRQDTGDVLRRYADSARDSNIVLASIDDGLFLLIKRAMNPLDAVTGSYRRNGGLGYESIRNRLTSVSIEAESDDYVKIGGLLYTLISLKEPPDSTYPGLLRELLSLDFPIVINNEIVVPDQAKVIRQYKWRQRKMMAAQRDIDGGFRVNVEAQVAERQLIQVLEDLISSSLKTCQASLVIVVRTSTPIRTGRDREEAERVIADRRQRVLQTMP